MCEKKSASQAKLHLELDQVVDKHEREDNFVANPVLIKAVAQVKADPLDTTHKRTDCGEQALTGPWLQVKARS